MVAKADGRLDWTQPARVLERRVRAFTPWPGAWTPLGEQILKVHRARVSAGSGPPGRVLAVSAEGPEVACGQGSLVLLEVQAEGKRRMPVSEFLRGHPLTPGTQPFDPPQSRTLTP